MKLIDEEDYLAFAAGDFVDHGLQTFLEFSTELGTGHQSSHIKRKQAFVLERIGNIAAHDSLCKTFDYCGLSYSRLADEHGVVLCLSGEHLHHTADLLITTDDRIHLALSGKGGHVAAVLLKSLILALGILVSDTLASADALQSLHKGITGNAVAL